MINILGIAKNGKRVKMKKKVLVLTGDYWHPTDSITPVLGEIFDEKEWDVTVTERSFCGRCPGFVRVV